MRAQQMGFNFDVFDMNESFTRPSVEDWEATARKAARERAAKERKAKEEREAREKAERERQEREETRRRAQKPRSPWEVLGVRMNAPQSEVRAAWVLLCKMRHPDAGGSLEEMQAINAAYQRLKDLERRKAA